MYWFGILAVFLWLYLMNIMKRANWTAVYTVIGVLGLFFFIVYLANYSMTNFLMKASTFGAGIFGSITGFYDVSVQYSMIQINSGHNVVNLFITYECSAVIELIAFIALTVFYPFFNGTKERWHWIMIGLPAIYLSNVIRLIVTATIIHFGGVGSLVWAHVIIGRVIFYTLTIILYYMVFTRAQVLNMRVGKFTFKKGANND